MHVTQTTTCRKVVTSGLALLAIFSPIATHSAKAQQTSVSFYVEGDGTYPDPQRIKDYSNSVFGTDTSPATFAYLAEGQASQGTQTAAISAFAGVGTTLVDASASSGYNTNEEIAISDNTVAWSDSFSVTSSSLPTGTPVQLQLSNTFSSFGASISVNAVQVPNVFLNGLAEFDAEARVTDSNGFDTANSATTQQLINKDKTTNGIDAITYENLTTYQSPQVIFAYVGDTINVSESFHSRAVANIQGDAFMNPLVHPTVFTDYPYYFMASTGNGTIPHDGGTGPDVSLIDATGHNWLTPVAGSPTDIADAPLPLSFSYSPAPEPSQCVILGLGIAGLSGLVFRARRRAT